ncbi:97d9e161-d5c3-41e3-90ba-230f1c0fcafb [Thermothielavioides terrestris]|uniref:97d9e161-d5c3-41e3-90ba-230f1c0fcafb n=1 Tax=Thermothielavioides terrestris TaxID=2587410 RepID=A0A3S4AUP2_9PEZI|nr:97d9e161-d5c3-41e3-90ba-230f1c0fcafb [Thermothielavioides terrestris]
MPPASSVRARIEQIDRRNVISAGSTGLIEHLPCGNVRKCVYSDRDYEVCLRDLEREFRVYQKLPQHDRLLQLIRYSPEEGLVLHDLKPENFLLDSNSRLKIIDFSGSSFDGIVGSAIESTRFFLPRPLKEPPAVRTDLFALGSTISEIMTSRPPYDDLSDDEVEARYSQQIFPSVQELPCGQLIMDCWRCEVQTAEEAMKRLKAELESALAASDPASSCRSSPPTTRP